MLIHWPSGSSYKLFQFILAERKKLELAEKYQTLKESKKLDQYMKKRRKKKTEEIMKST